MPQDIELSPIDRSPTEAGIGKYGGLQPTYAMEAEEEIADEHGFYGSMMNGLGSCIGFFGAFPCCICLPNPFKRVRQGTVGLVTKFGRFHRCVDPGLVNVNPVTEKIKHIDIRIQITELPRQVVMTKDNVSINIESVLFWHIINPYEAHFSVNDVRLALMERAKTCLRDVCGQHFLQDLIENRDIVSVELQKIIDPAAADWGVKVEATLVKDILFSQQLQDSLSSAAQAKRIGESKVIASRAEVEAAKLMQQAAYIMRSPASMQIRYLETLVSMSRSGNGPKTVFMPLPSSPSIENKDQEQKGSS
ncbi:stomatin family protein [Gongronella butleri]|nr:stomatin family protein [Gongronella butleri]